MAEPSQSSRTVRTLTVSFNSALNCSRYLKSAGGTGLEVPGSPRPCRGGLDEHGDSAKHVAVGRLRAGYRAAALG